MVRGFMQSAENEGSPEEGTVSPSAADTNKQLAHASAAGSDQKAAHAKAMCVGSQSNSPCGALHGHSFEIVTHNVVLLRSKCLARFSSYRPSAKSSRRGKCTSLFWQPRTVKVTQLSWPRCSQLRGLLQRSWPKLLIRWVASTLNVMSHSFRGKETNGATTWRISA